jgi:hypothetical protein
MPNANEFAMPMMMKAAGVGLGAAPHLLDGDIPNPVAASNV